MRRRVAHVISTQRGLGGAERVLLALVERTLGVGWEVRVLNPFAVGPDRSALAEALPAGILYERSTRSRRELPAARAWLAEHLQRWKPDLVHTHLFHAAVLAATVRRSGEARVLTHHHGSFLVQQRRLAEAKIDRWAGRRYDRVVAVSDAVRGFLIDDWAYPPERITVIRNGWTGEPCARAQTPANAPVVVCVANLRPEKGHHVLLQAFATVLQEFPTARLRLVGDGPLRDELRQLSLEMGLEGQVEWKGNVADVWPLLATATVAAQPSLEEPFGISVLEYMAAGLPVVASDAGGLVELVQPGTTGWRVAAGSADELGAALCEALGNSALRERFAEAGMRVAAELPLSATLDGYMALYDELVAPHV